MISTESLNLEVKRMNRQSLRLNMIEEKLMTVKTVSWEKRDADLMQS
mgnify:CR=1 FL=1